MATSKNRTLWSDIPAPVRAEIEQLVGGPVSTAQNCPGGFSPGFASRLTLADGRRVFVKAMDASTWPLQAMTHRTEARVAAALPPAVPAPRLLGTFDDGHWIVLAFEDIDGKPPATPWNHTDLHRVITAVGHLSDAGTPSPIALPREHPRLGGWAELTREPSCISQLPDHCAWAANNISRLIHLEEEGLAAAQGTALVHFDLYPHNILLTADRVVFVDWPHAQLGAPIVDLIMMLSSAAADGIDPEPVLPDHAQLEPNIIDAILAAHAGFLISGGLSPAPAGLEAITQAKLLLGHGALTWLQQRLARRS